jgi:hypothetical protein
LGRLARDHIAPGAAAEPRLIAGMIEWPAPIIFVRALQPDGAEHQRPRGFALTMATIRCYDPARKQVRITIRKQGAQHGRF